MKTGLKSLWFTMVHCCRRKFVGLCRIKNSVWTGNEGGSEGPNTTKQGIDWIVLLCTFVGCLLRLQWPAFVYVCLLSGHAASDGHRIPDQGALSLSVSVSKRTNCGHLASLLLKELHDRQWIILVLKLIDFSQCVGGASNEGRRTPEQGTQRCDHEKQAESGEMLNMIMIARDTCSLAMWLCFLSPSWVLTVRCIGRRLDWSRLNVI